MVKAVWNGVTLAASEDTVIVEGNHYFPPDAVTPGVLKPSDAQTICSWKGVAHYYTVAAGGAENSDAAWYYPDPKPEAAKIKGRIAFWKGVRVS